jgi:hypothetical protein
VLVAAVRALAVDRHRRRDDQLLDPVAMRKEGFEQHGRAEGVGVHVTADLVHRLADADLRRLMEDRVDAVDGTRHEIGVGDVAVQELDAVGNVLGAARVVDLGDEAVENAHGVPSLEQRLGEMRPDEPGSPGHEYAQLAQPGSPPDAAF